MGESTFFKALYYIFIGWATSLVVYFDPIHDLIIAISIAFITNFIFGLLAGIAWGYEKFEIKKGLNAFKEVAIYLAILTFIFTIGDRMHNIALINKFLWTLTMAWICFYVSNVFKNLNKIAPDSNGIEFAYFIFSLQFLKKIPAIKGFERYKKNKLK